MKNEKMIFIVTWKKAQTNPKTVTKKVTYNKKHVQNEKKTDAEGADLQISNQIFYSLRKVW